MNIGLPNQITLARLVIAIVFFGLLSTLDAHEFSTHQGLIAVCFWLFLTGALSDVLDGYLARAWGQVTTFGRIVDPVVDKVLICGAFIFFCSRHFSDPARGSLTGVEPWMAIVILLRELVVSAVRSVAEAQGQKFPANWAGKFKMFLQSTTICFILGELAWYPGLATTRLALVWATVIVTALSAWPYLVQARRCLSEGVVSRARAEESKIVSAPLSAPGILANPAPQSSGGASG